MSARLALITLLFLSSGLGCDSSDTSYADCVSSDETSMVAGARVDKCPPSTFKTEDARAREVSGIVRRGEEMVPAALLKFEPWAGFAPTSGTTVSTITDASGGFSGVRPISLRYDLTVLFDPSSVIVYRGLAARYVEPSIEVTPRNLPRAWVVPIDVHLDATSQLGEGQTLAFFSTPDTKSNGVIGDWQAGGVSMLMKDYDSSATLHAVAYEKAKGLSSATAYGKIDVFTNGSTASFATMHLDPITSFGEPTVAIASNPAGVTATEAEIRIVFTRTSEAHFATLPIGAKSPTKLPVIPNAGYTYRVQGTRDGAIADTSEVAIDLQAQTPTLATLPPIPVIEGPAEGGTIAAGDILAAKGQGLLEHLLTPASAPSNSAPSIRVVVSEGETPLPSIVAAGASRPVGPYTWTVRSYNASRFPEELTGLDVRRYRPVGVSKPRSIQLQ